MAQIVRPRVTGAAGNVRAARAGDGWMAAPLIATQSTDSNQTIGVAALSGGIYLRTGLTLGRTDTTDTAANILAAWTNMDIGDTYVIAISNGSAQTLTIAGGTGVTIAGQTTVLANTMRFYVFTRTGTATLTATGL